MEMYNFRYKQQLSDFLKTITSQRNNKFEQINNLNKCVITLSHRGMKKKRCKLKVIACPSEVTNQTLGN